MNKKKILNICDNIAIIVLVLYFFEIPEVLHFPKYLSYIVLAAFDIYYPIKIIENKKEGKVKIIDTFLTIVFIILTLYLIVIWLYK